MQGTALIPTLEQHNALELFETGDSLAIEAGAGTGKTSTLRLLAENTKRRGQYIAFNKAIVVEAGSKMPRNVACNTAHSLAMRAVGRKYEHRLASPRMRSWDIARKLGLNDIWVERQDQQRKKLSGSYLAGLTMRAITRFCQSADLEPTGWHAPYIDGLDVPPGAHENNDHVRRLIDPAVKKAWADLQSVGGTLPFRHDHYLKMWQLSEPTIYADFILFDEAQDANPVMSAIVSAQKHAQLVWVGDTQQQIYSFTGAVNALAQVPAKQRAFLTQSFRFGPAIAEVANTVLDALNAELRIEGYQGIESTVGEIEDPDVVLTRTNATAVQTVLEALKDGKRVHLVGGAKEIVSFAKAAQALMDGRGTDHPELACFETWREVQDYVEQDEQGGDLRLLVTLIDDFTVPVILDALDQVSSEADADLIVSTAHKAKGREWNAVKLAADFPPDAGEEELRLLYVAITRARFRIDHTAVPFFDRREEQPEEAAGEGVAAPVTAVEATPTAEPAEDGDAPEAPVRSRGGGPSRVIRVDDEVKAALDRERQPDERNYNAAIRRILVRQGALGEGGSDAS